MTVSDDPEDRGQVSPVDANSVGEARRGQWWRGVTNVSSPNATQILLKTEPP